MDDLDQREAFLLAIFTNPDDDLPRLVFADWLDENGEAAWAELIRVQCMCARTSPADLSDLERLTLRQVQTHNGVGVASRGFLKTDVLHCPTDLLADPVEFRRRAILQNPEWYGCVELKAEGRMIASSKPINTILNSPVTQRVTKLDLSGALIEVEREGGDGLLSEFEYHPIVSFQAVEALVSARECRRFTHLDLRNNDLDNDAARAILRSNYLTRLESLQLGWGQLRGRTWNALREKFGEEVVS